jgi:type IV pilus assembly protein PilA
MGQPVAAEASPRFCGRCGAALPGPVPACPRCGGATAAPKRGTNWTAIIIVGVAVLFGAPCVLGVLAAIAIPNFVKYQLRSKASEVTVEVHALVGAEQAQLAAGGKYAPLPRMPDAAPGTSKVALGAEEQQAASRLGWMTQGMLYGRYAVAVSEDGSAAAICGESDIDGDGVLHVEVAFLPSAGGAAPAAPSSAPVAYAGQPAGTVEHVSPPDAF